MHTSDWAVVGHELEPLEVSKISIVLFTTLDSLIDVLSYVFSLETFTVGSHSG